MASNVSWLPKDVLNAIEGGSSRVMCTCKNTCSRKASVRGGCPCRTAGIMCERRPGGCTCGTKRLLCSNIGDVLEDNYEGEEELEHSSESSSDSSDFEEPGFSEQVIGSEMIEEDMSDKIQRILDNSSNDQLRKVCAVIAKEDPQKMLKLLQQDPEDPCPPERLAPQFCFCQMCKEMPSAVENKCCQQRRCLTLEPKFQKYCLDKESVELTFAIRGALMLEDFSHMTNENYRYASYFALTAWKHGYLGRGNRVVIPACCVSKIRATFPEANGNYKGFIPGRLPN